LNAPCNPSDIAIHPRSPWEFVPASARKVSVSFSACRSGDAWAVYQDTRWKDSEGWDGDCTRLVSGLTEALARDVVAELSGEAGFRASQYPPRMRGYLAATSTQRQSER